MLRDIQYWRTLLKEGVSANAINSLYGIPPPALCQHGQPLVGFVHAVLRKLFVAKCLPKLTPKQGPASRHCYHFSHQTRSCWRTYKNLEKRSVCRQLNVFGGRKRWRPKDGRNHRESFRSTCSPIRTGSPTSRRSRSGLTPRTHWRFLKWQGA